VLQRADVEIKRPGTGIPPTALDTVVGRRLTRPVVEDEVLTFDCLEGGEPPGAGTNG
jgi:sialic acid synthase SpsE